MGIECISNNFFPFDPEKKPTSIVATSSLVVTVVSAILIGVACGLSWGVPAIATLAAMGAVAVIVTLAIVLYKEKGAQKQIPIPSRHFPQAFDQAQVNLVQPPPEVPMTKDAVKISSCVKEMAQINKRDLEAQVLFAIEDDNLNDRCKIKHYYTCLATVDSQAFFLLIYKAGNNDFYYAYWTTSQERDAAIKSGPFSHANGFRHVSRQE